MSFEEQLVFFRNNGFHKFSAFYSPYEISFLTVKIGLLNTKNSKLIHESDCTTIRSIMSYHKNEVFEQFTRDNRILRYIENVLKSKVYVSQSKINLKKGKKGKKWDFHRGFTFWHLLDGKPKPNMISVFICLTKQTIENGAMYVLTGSHKGFDIDTMHKESEIANDTRTGDTASSLSIQIKDAFIKKYQSKFEKVYLEGDVGDVFFMDSRLLHASDNNKTNKSRDLMITVYNSIDNLPTNNNRPNYLCERDFTPLKPFHF